MPTIDPKWAFYIGALLCVTQVIDASGPTLLQNAIPASAIVIIIAWCGIITKIGVALFTYISGTNMTQAGRIASVKTLPLQTRADSFSSDPKVEQVVLKDQATADATNSSKVVGPQDVQK